MNPIYGPFWKQETSKNMGVSWGPFAAFSPYACVMSVGEPFWGYGP